MDTDTDTLDTDTAVDTTAAVDTTDTDLGCHLLPSSNLLSLPFTTLLLWFRHLFRPLFPSLFPSLLRPL